MTFNRTKSELKPVPAPDFYFPADTFNRTKSELKHLYTIWQQRTSDSFNRTKSELKLKLSLSGKIAE